MALVGAMSVAAGTGRLLLAGHHGACALYLIAAWAVVRGVVEIVAAIRLRKQIRTSGCSRSAGILSIVFGALVAPYPGAGALSVVWVIGLFAIAFGVTTVALAFRLRACSGN